MIIRRDSNVSSKSSSTSNSNNNSNNNNSKFDIEEYDDKGWTPLHHAAHSGYFKTVNRLLQERLSRMEVRTEDRAKVTSLWLAFASGQVETVDILMMYGADVSISSADEEMDLIDVALANDQYRFLVHMMEKGSVPQMNNLFWTRLLENISPENINHNYCILETSLKVVGSLKMSPIDLENHGKSILEHVMRLYQPDLICDHLELELMINNIIKNFILLSAPSANNNNNNNNNDNTINFRKFLSNKTNLFDVLTERLLQVVMHHQVSGVILYILKTCCQPVEFVEQMMQKKRFLNLVEYMVKTVRAPRTESNDVEDDRDHFLVDCFQIVNKHLSHNETVQDFFHQKTDLLAIAVDILKSTNATKTTTKTTQLQIECLKTIRKLACDNRPVQTKLKAIQIFEVLKGVLSKSTTPFNSTSNNTSNSSNKAVMKQICKIVCTTTSSNIEMQAHFITSGAIHHLTAQIKKIKEDSSHEWIMQALYSIAGNDHRQTMMVAKALPVPYVVSVATSNSSLTLQYYGCEILNVLLRTTSGSSSNDNSHHIPESAASGVMLHLLNSSLKSSFVLAKEKLISGLRTIQSLAMGVGYVPARKIQKIALEKNAIYVLLQVATKSNHDPWIELEVYQTIACLLFNNKAGEKVLRESLGGKFPPPAVVRYISSRHPRVERALRHKASHILSYFMLDKERKTAKGLKIDIGDLYDDDNTRDASDDSDGDITDNNVDGVTETTAAEVPKQNDNGIGRKTTKEEIDAAFQRIVLKDSIVSSSSTNLHYNNISPAQSVVIALQVLRHGLATETSDDNVRAITAHHISGLAQYCPGMKAAFTADEFFMDALCDTMMRSDEDDIVKTAVAVAISNLARCLRTEIVLFKKCRENRTLFGLISTWSPVVKLPIPFCEKWNHYMSLTK